MITVKAKTGKVIEEVEDTINDVLDDFDDFEDEAEEGEAEEEEIPEEKIVEATDYLNKFKEFIRSKNFKQQINETAKEYGIPPKKLAQNFFEKALGTVGDILGVAISVVCNAGRTIVRIAGSIANTVINLIESLFNGAVRVITLNKTCVA